MSQIKQYKHYQPKFMKSLSAVISALFVVSTVHALEPILDISQTPLELTPTVAPNVMILLDDSGSMDFEVMTADALSSGLFFGPNPDGSNFGSMEPELEITQRTGCELKAAAFGGYAYGIFSSENLYQGNVSQDDESINLCQVADARAWRFRCPTFNTLYYNPNVDYKPWVGFRDDGNEFVNVSPEAAPLNPYLGNSPTINLLSPAAATGIDAFRLYSCGRDENGNFENLSDQIEGGTLDDGIPIVDMDNFANWFTYHRSRHLRAKSLLGEYVASESGTRIGLVNFRGNDNLPVEEMNASIIDDGAKRTLLDALYSTVPNLLSSLVNPAEDSPLADRYQQTRNYLACENNDVFPNNIECPAEDAPAGTCQANNIIVATDGFYDRITGIANNDIEGSGPPVTLQLRNGPFDGGDFRDEFANTIADIAISFYENDLQPTLPNEVVPETAEVNISDLDEGDRLHQHIKTHIVTIQPSLAPEVNVEIEIPPWENDPATNDLGLLENLVHAAFNARGQYIDIVNTSNDLSAVVQDLVRTITSGVGSTTPVAINTQATSANVVLYRTFFDSFSNSGDLVAQEIIINDDGSLNIDSDDTPEFLWSAAEQLDRLIEDDGSNNAQRNIITYSNQANDGIEFDFDQLDPSQQELLSDPRPFPEVNLGEDRLIYLRGGLVEREGTSFENNEFRIRPETDSTIGTNAEGNQVVHNAKLGTIANAAPIFVGQPQAVGRFGGAWPSDEGQTYFDFQTSQAGRDASILVAANDGMFHVFNAETGNERYAYIPSFVFENLSQLTLPEYQHQFFVDSTPSVEDAYIRATPGGSLSWNTIVVGGLGAGGRGFYALNVTDDAPEDIPSDQVLWEFGPEDDPDANADGSISDLGFSFGRPLIAMSNANDGDEQRWIAIFGNGYNSTSPDGEAVIYALFIDRGIDGSWEQNGDLVKINTGIEGIDRPNGIADVRGIDTDGNGTVDRLYAGDLEGNLHVVNISSSTPNDWALNSNRFILLKATGPDGNKQPITTRPIAVNNESGDGVIVIVATGSYFATSDAIDTNIQSIYGVEDSTAENDAVGTRVQINNLTKQELENNLFVDEALGISLDVRTVSANLPEVGDQGWFIDFDVENINGSGIEFPGEKAVRELQLRNDILFVNTLIPQELSCNPAPGGFSLALDPQDGTAGDQVIFDINADNVFDDQDNISTLGAAGIIVGTRFDSTPSDSTFFGDYRITQLSNTDIVSFQTNPEQSDLVGRQAWREVEF
ncbi:MAG: pilus assembly protein [Gammaproteobacteria bacterium]